MVDLSGEGDLWRLERVICWEMDRKEKDTTGVWGVWRTHDGSLPVIYVIAYWASRTGGWGVSDDKKWNKAQRARAREYIDSRQIPNLLVLLSVVIYNNIGCDEMKWMNHRTGFIKYATPPRTTHKRSLCPSLPQIE